MLAAILLITGCSKTENMPTLVPVSGNVTLDGRPVTAGQVTFFPEFNTKAGMCTGTINTEGAYEIKTSSDNQTKSGAPPGKYKVTVTPSMVAEMKTTKGGKLKTDFNPRYTDMKNTPLRVEVDDSGKTYDLKLTKK
jgi:hypothetical protein